MTAAQESLIRLGVFLGTLALMASWEWLAPRRAWTLGNTRRWLTMTKIRVHGLACADEAGELREAESSLSKTRIFEFSPGFHGRFIDGS